MDDIKLLDFLTANESSFSCEQFLFKGKLNLMKIMGVKAI